MSYYRFAEMAVALCFGLTFALVGWWEIAGPIWREECAQDPPNSGWKSLRQRLSAGQLSWALSLVLMRCCAESELQRSF